MKVYEKIYNKLCQKQVKDIFLYSGGAIMSLIDCFHFKNNSHNINTYIATNESHLTSMAVGYSKIKNYINSKNNETGVVITTSGPGLTNCVSNILDANCDSTPLLVISGQVSLNAMGKNSFQEAPSIDITKKITKFNYLLEKANETDYIIEKAFYHLHEDKKGAVHIDIPKCVLNSDITFEIQNIFFNVNKCLLNTFLCKKVIDIINQSERPVFYIGKGASNCKKILKKIVDKTNIPVTTTLLGLGIFNERHYCSLKMLGMHGSYMANMSIQNADTIICVGARFDDRCTGNVKHFAPRAKNIIHINIEPSEFGKVIQNSINVLGDCKEVLEYIEPGLKNVSICERSDWLDCIIKWRMNFPFNYDRKKFVSQKVIECINECLKEDEEYIFVTGVGNHQMYVAQYITFNEKRYHITSGSLGNMECGLPYAIGCKIAEPNKKVICIIGDGCFNMSYTELTTLKRYNLDIKIFVLNNSSLDMVRCWENIFFDNHIVATSLDNCNFNLLAEAHDIKNSRIDNHYSYNKMKQKIQSILNSHDSHLCNVIVETDYCLPLVKPGKALDEMMIYKNGIIDINGLDKQDSPN